MTVILHPERPGDDGIILELKVDDTSETAIQQIKNKKKKEHHCKIEVLEQIERMQYARNLRIEGYRTVLSYGAAFLGKDCLIKLAKEKEQ